MDIVGRSERPVDRVAVELDYLSLESLSRLAERLKSTTEKEQYLFREVELDCCFRQADGELLMAKRANDPARIERAAAVRAKVFAAHDFVGTRELTAAIAQLDAVADLVTGLD